MKIETGLIIGNQITKLIKLIPIIIIEKTKQNLKIRSSNLYSFFPTYLFLAIYKAAVMIVKIQKELINKELVVLSLILM